MKNLKFIINKTVMLIPAKYVTDNGVRLGRWFTKQRELYSKGTLADDRIELLEKYPISWSYFEDMWNKHYAYLKAYYDETGNSDVPCEYITRDGFELGRWLSEQRVAYKNRLLNKRRIKLLKQLEFRANPIKERWDDFYYLLEEYYNNHGNANPPTGYVTEKGYKLGNRANMIRQAYKGTNSRKLNKDQIMLLNDLNFDWSPKDTTLLNSNITASNEKEFKRVMLERMKHILEDISYEMNGNITSVKKQEKLEKSIIKRMWC